MENSETWRSEALKSFSISKSGMQGAKDVWIGRPDTPSDGGGSQWSEQHIRIGYATVWVWCSLIFSVPRASSWGSSDKGARHMSSWGIRMELLRIAMCAPCHQGEGSLHHTHADGHPCDVPSSPDISHSEFCPGDVPPSPDISHPAPDAGWERRAFQLPRQTYPDPLIAFARRVSQPFCTVPRCSPKASRYVRPTFWDILL